MAHYLRDAGNGLNTKQSMALYLKNKTHEVPAFIYLFSLKIFLHPNCFLKIDMSGRNCNGS